MMNKKHQAEKHSSFNIHRSTLLSDLPGGKEERRGVRFPGGLPACKRAKFIDMLEETKIE
jgi:hypothetical protein